MASPAGMCRCNQVVQCRAMNKIGHYQVGRKRPSARTILPLQAAFPGWCGHLAWFPGCQHTELEPSCCHAGGLAEAECDDLDDHRAAAAECRAAGEQRAAGRPGSLTPARVEGDEALRGEGCGGCGVSLLTGCSGGS